MIKINLSINQMQEIEKIWFKWFVWGDRIHNFIMILENDPTYRSMIFSSYKEFEDWKNEFIKNEKIKNNITWRKPIHRYIFANLADENSVIKKYKKDLQQNTIEYLLDLYKTYRESSAAVRIIDIMKIEVCPYCNRNFMENYSYKSKKYFKGDLDHHFSKDEIPALAISFYNLVPCCKICNHEKAESRERTFYPFYNDENIEYQFRIELYDEEDELDIVNDTIIDNIEMKRYDSTVWQGISDNFNIRLRGIDKIELNECMKNSNEIFRLEKKYNHSKEYVKDIIRKKYIYPEVHKELLLKNFGMIFCDESAILESFYSYSNNDEYLYNRPLAKLTKDILNQMGMI